MMHTAKVSLMRASDVANIGEKEIIFARNKQKLQHQYIVIFVKI